MIRFGALRSGILRSGILRSGLIGPGKSEDLTIGVRALAIMIFIIAMGLLADKFGLIAEFKAFPGE